jgi:F-box and WD-40 domain protein 1/11
MSTTSQEIRTDGGIDPSRVLPEELFAHIVSFLDAASLVTAELVSKRWYSTSNSYHTWRHCFAREYSLSCALNASLSQTGGLGLGKQRPDQDWKRMWKVRKTLEHRWKNGQAAAIYLEGHKDSVYCVQFDE